MRIFPTKKVCDKHSKIEREKVKDSKRRLQRASLYFRKYHIQSVKVLKRDRQRERERERERETRLSGKKKEKERPIVKRHGIFGFDVTVAMIPLIVNVNYSGRLVTISRGN